MACTYIYKEHRFTERELDEFLMNGGIDFINKYGDEVFSLLTLELNNIHKRVIPYIKAALEVRNKHILEVLSTNNAESSYVKSVLGIYEGSEGSYYKPITHFLKGVRSIITDKLLMPEFILDNYFNERVKDWLEGNFKKDEFDLLFPDGNKPDVITTEMINDFKAQIIEMWEALAKLGSEVHKGCQIYFSGKDKVLYRTLPKQDVLLIMREKLDLNVVSEENLELIYDYCRNLHQGLRVKYGCADHLDLNFYTELTVYGDVLHPETLEPTGLLGMVDLLVVDPKGNMHIIDYKTSPHDYYKEDNTEGGYSSAKKLAFTYQLNIYDRLLYNALNVNPPSHDINVAPIQLLNFKKGLNGWSFNGLSYDSRDFIDNLTFKASSISTVNDNLDLMIPIKRLKDVDGSEIFSKVGTAMGELFLKHSRITKKDDKGKKQTEHKYQDLNNSRLITFEEAQQFAEERGIEENDRGEYSVQLFRNLTLTAKTKNELIEKTRNKLNGAVNRVSDYVNTIKNAVELEKGDELHFGSRIRYEDQEITWSEDTLGQYCDGSWKLIQVPPELEAMGCILLRNIYTEAVDVLKISHNITSKLLNLEEGRKNLTAKFESDIVEDSKSNSYMLKSKLGNIDLMEAMLAINLMPNRFEDLRINKIQVINPEFLEGITASARELKYCFKALRNHAKNIKDGKWLEYMEVDNFENGSIHLCSAAELAYNDYKAAVNGDAFKSEGVKIFESAADELELLVFGKNPDATLEKLKEIRRRLELKFPYLKKKAKVMKEFGNDGLERVYSELDIAIADLLGIGFRQLVEDPLKYGDVKIWKGHLGLYTDNPGTMNNFNINMLTQCAMNAYQIVRNNMQEGVAHCRNIMQKLKKDNSFNYFKERFGGNKVNLFKGMTYINSDGDWLMVNPENLSGAKKEFAEYFLKVVNENRFGKENAQKYKEDNDIRYYRIPLAVGGSMWQVNSAMETLKFKLSSLLPENIKEQAKDKLYNLLSETDESERNTLNDALWEMTTKFDGGENETNRLIKLKQHPAGYFEHDLEKVLLMHMHAYETKRAMDDVLPIFRAGQVFQIFSKLSQNRSYQNSLKYLLDFVKVSIFNKTLLTDRLLVIKEYANKLMSVASKMALGFSPRQLYQGIEGIWKGIGLVLRNPTGNTLDGTHQFNKNDFVKSFFNTMTELGHFGNRRSKLELINEKYGLNDMDTNMYAQRLLDDHSLIYNFDTFTFRMASRPDFYNRMTIFQTLMRADGTWEAHSIKDGQLIYDWNKDTRFSALSRNNKSDPKYNELFALYKEMFELMKKEGLIDRSTTIYDSDGKIRPLPQAYTIQLSESYKALSDMLYGYYSHEKRSLMQATLIGGLTLQMYTYWSGKKNQYLAASSIKNQGKYVHEKNSEGKPLYYLLDENGLPDYTKDPVTENTGAPVIKWLGQFSEGVITTLSNMALELYGGRSISSVFDSYWNNPDENLKTIYRSNMIQLLYETSMFTLLGGIIGNMVLDASKDYVKDNPPLGNFAQGLTNTAAQIGADIYNASFLDLNFIDSIGSRGINWTPFSISTMLRTFQNFSSFLGGKKDFENFITGLTSATRQIRPAIHAVFDEVDGD